MLWGLLAAAIPIIIHLLNRRRHRTVKWAAMQFLLKATRESRGKKKLRHILILTCRTLAVATLITAAALPITGGFFGFGGGKPEMVIIVLDRSATMDTVPRDASASRRELAIQRLRDALQEIPGTRAVLIDSASGKPQDLPSPEVLAELSSTAGTDTAARIPELLVSAAAYLNDFTGRAEIWVASDLQSTNWQADDGAWENARAALGALTQPLRLRILSISGESSPNQLIHLHSARRAGESLVIDVEILRTDSATQPLNLPVTTQLDGAASTESITIVGQQFRFQKSIPLPSPEARGHGWLSIPGDGNPRDNVTFFAYGPSRKVRSLVVGTPGEAANFMKIAAAPGGFGGQEAEIVRPDTLGNLSEIAAIFWLDALPTGAAADQITRFLEDGGQVVFAAPEKEEATRFLDIAWQPVNRSAADQFFILDSWDHKDGLLRDGIDGTPIPADRLRAIQRRIPDGEASVLARWDDGEPFLTRRIVGKGTAWFLGSIPDYRWSNLGDADVLLPAAQRSVIEGANRFDAGLLAPVGSLTETATRIDGFPNNDRAESLHLAGVFQTSEDILALNRPLAEDIPGAISPDTLDVLLAGTDFSLFEDQRASARDKLGSSIWWLFLSAMLLFLLAEAILCLPKRVDPATATAPQAALFPR
ncbi:MAG: BatA and WFA domain-containing protein [Akkermansiaceae bacterium]|nr:BatA and WFA domain-containing protein [Akkermansiaceae bacterium]